MANPITTNDIIKIGNIQNELQGFAEAVKGYMEGIKQSILDATNALQGMGAKDNVSQVVTGIETETKKYEQLEQQLKRVQNELEALKKKKGDAVKPEIGDAELINSYRSLAQVMKEAGISADQLQISEKAKTQAVKYGQQAADSARGSYNQLYAQYNLLKIALNSLNGEMRNNAKIGGLMEKESLKIMNTLKRMQEATGKHTLSVGDYGKALNGLNIATTQVLREMPTIANSWSQFFIAISNNVPIFVDQFNAVVRATDSVKKALLGTLGAIFSWQTALLALLTYLPILTKRIQENRKATKELGDETMKIATYYKLMQETAMSWLKAEVDTTTEMRTWIKVAQNANRTQEDRINAGLRLKQLFKDELDGYTAEDIAIGNANAKLEELNESLQRQAYIRASLNKLTELYNKQIDLEFKAQDLARVSYKSGEVRVGSVKQISERIDHYQKLGYTIEFIKKHLITLDKEAWKNVEAYRSANAEMREIEKSTKRIIAVIPTNGIVEETLSGRGRKAKDTEEDIESLGMTLESFYKQMINSFLNLLPQGFHKKTLSAEYETYFALTDLATKFDEIEKYSALTGINITRQTQELMTILSNTWIDGLNKVTQAQKEWQAELDSFKTIPTYGGSYSIAFDGGATAERLRANLEEKRGFLSDEEIARREEFIKRLENVNEQIIVTDDEFEREREKAFKDEVQALNSHYDNLNLLAVRDNKNRYRRKREQIKNELAFWEDYKQVLIEGMQWTDETEAKYWANVEALQAKYEETLPTSFIGYLGMWANEGWSQKFEQNLENAFNTAFQYMEHWMDYRIQMADVAIESAEREREAAKEVLDYEREARANGYANNVELAKREYDEKLAIEQQAIKEKQKLQKIQEAIDTATQASSLITATANLWSSLAGIPAVGYILAAAATTAMFGSFLAAKVQAHKVAGATYGDGMSEYLDYGGSHASGNDIDFGRMKDGTPRRVERGEVIGVINKRNVRKYGANEVQNIINSLNKGTFEQKYGNAFADFSISNPTDISGISSDVKAIKEQGESKVYVTGGKTIKVYKNLTRVIR